METIKELICERHGQYIAKVIQCLGTEIVMKCPKCKEEDKAREEAEKKIEENRANKERIAIWINKANLPMIYRGLAEFAPLETQRKAILDYDFKKNLIIYGSVGTGKTMYASWLGIQAIKKGLTTRYLYANEIEKKAKASWGTNLTEDDFLEQYIDCDLLILDEIGRVQYNDYLFKVFDGRYMNNKPIILLGNIEISEIPKILGEAIASRLRTNIKAISFGTEDIRIKG